MDPAPKPPESLSGLIDRVTFFNEEDGFAVLKIIVEGHREEVTVVGSLPSVNPGEWLTAEGHWVQDREFGRQFRALLLKSTPPTTREGIEKYLGSRMVRGIGPIYAKKLVAKFGEKIFDVIENTSGRLEEVEGLILLLANQVGDVDTQRAAIAAARRGVVATSCGRIRAKRRSRQRPHRAVPRGSARVPLPRAPGRRGPS